MLDIKINNYFYDYVLDFTATKTLNLKKLHRRKNKHISIAKFDNEALEPIRFPKIFNHPDIIKQCSIIHKRKVVSPPSHIS